MELRKLWFSVTVQAIWQWEELFIFFQKLSWDLKASGVPFKLTLVQQPSSYCLTFLKALFPFTTSICGAIWSLRKLPEEFSLLLSIILSAPLIEVVYLVPIWLWPTYIVPNISPIISYLWPYSKHLVGHGT